MHFKWNVPDIHEKDEQSELATMGSICRFYNHRKLEQTKLNQRKKRRSALEINANALVKQNQIYLTFYGFSLMKHKYKTQLCLSHLNSTIKFISSVTRFKSYGEPLPQG